MRVHIKKYVCLAAMRIGVRFMFYARFFEVKIDVEFLLQRPFHLGERTLFVS